MPRLALAVALCAVLLAAGCGGGGGGSSTRAPESAAPIHRGDNAAAAARQTAAYRTAINAVLTAYSTAQRRAFGSLRRAKDESAFVASLQRLRRATLRAANRLDGEHPPAAAAEPHRRFVAAFRSLARILQTAIDARNRSDFTQLRRVGRRLSSGEFSRPIVDAAKQIDSALQSG